MGHITTSFSFVFFKYGEQILQRLMYGVQFWDIIHSTEENMNQVGLWNESCFQVKQIGTSQPQLPFICKDVGEMKWRT